MTGGATRKSRQTASLPGSPALCAESFNPEIEIPRDEIAAFCGKWGVAELSLFGSALRGDFRPESDIDLLVRFAPGKEYGLLAFARMREELETIFGRPVDLVAERAVERSENQIKRRHILATKVVIHAAG
jgi:predicted nucleotidyltransferase